MKGECFIGVDCSTQSTKAVLFDCRGRALREARSSHMFRSPHNGWAEQDATELWDSLCAALRTLTDGLDLQQIEGMGIAYQRETFVLLDGKGREIRPAILWLDQRSLKEVEEIRRDIGGEYFQQLTGKILNTLPSLPKIKWIRNSEPEHYRRIDKLCDVGAYLNWKLTGRMISPFSGADTTGLFGLKARDWADDLLAYIGLNRENMPDVVPAGTEVGGITAKAAAATGLPEGFPVFAAGGDGQVFAVGVGSMGADALALSLGTSVVWGVHNSEYRTSSYFRTMMSCQPGTYYCESALISGSNTIKWFIDEMGGEEIAQAKARKISPESLLEDKIRDIDPGCDGLITLPYWRGVMNPYDNPGARGMTLGWSDYHTRYHFYRSILEGIAFELRLVTEGYGHVLGISPQVFRVGSGGAQSEVWAQIISDVNGMDVMVTDSHENTALGAAMIAAWGAGVYDDLREASERMSPVKRQIASCMENHEIYSRLYNTVYKNMYLTVQEYLTTLGSYGLNTHLQGTAHTEES